MIEFLKPITPSDEFMNRYWHGPSNKFSRYFTYIEGGFGLYNNIFKYIATAFTAYWTIKTADYWLVMNISDMWLTIGMGVVSIIGIGVLGWFGRWQFQKLNKAREVAVAMESSLTGFNGYNMSVLNTALFIAIAEKQGINIEELKTRLFKSE